jgi:signal transduction histidine kinase
MVFNSRSFQMLVVGALLVMAIFTYDSAIKGRWANLVLGGCLCAALLMALAATSEIWHIASAEPSSPAKTSPENHYTLFDQLPMPLISSSDGVVLMAVNRAARALFETDDVIRTGGDELSRALSEPISSSRPILQIQGRRYALSVSEIFTEGASARMAALTDVQGEINRAEAAALKDTLHILSHEIMNSLTPVAALADTVDGYLQSDTNPAARPAKEALETLARRATNLTRFIEAYRSVARLPDPELQPVDPGRLIVDLMTVLQHHPMATDVDFQLELADNLPKIAMDESLVGQAIINILTNAIEATEDVAPPRRIGLTVQVLRETLVVKISDNGVGVPESIKKSMFTAFTTTKSKGSGAGLNLARQIALAHGGNLELLDPVGNWKTTFAFTFPINL